MQFNNSRNITLQLKHIEGFLTYNALRETILWYYEYDKRPVQMPGLNVILLDTSGCFM
jgi:hypothetical protein